MDSSETRSLPSARVSPPPAERQSRPYFQKISLTLSAGEGEALLTTGDLLGDYCLVRKLDNGSFGQVWEGRDTRTDASVAIKVFDRSNFRGSELEAAERFCDGASAMARLRGAPHVIELYEGPSFDLGRGLIWFSMKFYPERDLEGWRKRSALSVEVRLRLVSDLLAALHAAHRSNPQIVHRDVRPKNVLIEIRENEARAILIDFDIAYYEDVYRQRQSTVHPLGELRYIPPDVSGAGSALAQKLRRASNDLFALAVVTLDLFTDSDLPLDSSRTQIAHAIAKATATNPDPWLRKSLATFLHRALQQSEKARFRDVSEYETAWRAATKPNPTVKLAIAVAALMLLPAFLVLADWVWSTSTDSLWIGVFASGVALLGASSALVVLLGWLSSLIFPYASRLQHRLLALCQSRALIISIAVVAAACATVIGAAMTHPLERLRSARLVFSAGCLGVDSSETIRFVADSKSPQVFQLPVKEVRCVTDDKRAPTIEGFSLLAPLPTVRSTPHPTGAVALKELVGHRVRYKTASGTLTNSLRCIKPPGPAVAPDFLAITPGAVQQAMLSLGHEQDSVEVTVGDINVGQELIRRGFAFADRSCAGDQGYQEAESEAKALALGVWHENEAQTETPRLSSCPNACCADGHNCEEIKDCKAKAKCVLCRLGDAAPKWRIKLARLEFPNAHHWTDVKVCLTSSSNDCGQTCVNVDDIGTPLEEYKCPYGSGDLRWVTVEVLGKRAGSATEVGIAQRMSWFNSFGVHEFCTGLRVTGLDSKKDAVNQVAFTASVRTPTVLAGEGGPFRVVVERSESPTIEAKHAYHYRIDATDDALGEIAEISMTAQAKGLTRPLNGPVAWKGCRINGSRMWVPVGDGNARTCDETVFKDACECRFVLTSGACAPVNTMSIRLRNGKRAEGTFDACRALGEIDGELSSTGYKFELQQTPTSNWQFLELPTGRTMSCGLSCGPPAAIRRPGSGAP